MIQPKFSRKCILPVLSALVTLTLSYANGFATLPTDLNQRQHCIQERTYKMLGYNCANLNLNKIPQSLKSNLEIFDLSFNRIRDLNKASFTRYSNVKFLYLFDNMIQNIEEGTFSQLTSLEALDLSTNALTTIPLELFQLPMLRNLYMANNVLRDLDRDLIRLEKPVSAPLEMINLADCRLNRLPNFGILPDLWKLNISSNAMTELALEQFLPLCNLKTIDVNNTQIPLCVCQVITTELTARGATLRNNHPHCTPLYSSEQSICSQEVESLPTNTDFQQCMEVRKSRQLSSEAKTAWLKISLIVLGCIVLFALILYCFHRRNAKNLKKSKKHKKNAVPIHKVMVPSSEAESIVENGNRDKLINDCD